MKKEYIRTVNESIKTSQTPEREMKEAYLNEVNLHVVLSVAAAAFGGRQYHQNLQDSLDPSLAIFYLHLTFTSSGVYI